MYRLFLRGPLNPALTTLGLFRAVIKWRKCKHIIPQYHNRNNYGGQGGGGGNFNQNQGPFEATSNFAVGKEYVGIVIGRGGDTIKRLQSETGAKGQFNTIDPNAPGDRYLVIQGTKEQVAEVEGQHDLIALCIYFSNIQHSLCDRVEVCFKYRNFKNVFAVKFF